MDPIVIATSIQEKVYFLAAGEYMGKGIKFWFMNRFLNMIPIYRPETMPGQTQQNAAIFEKCIEHLNKRKTIIVFPEGVSSTEKRILPLKTGVARIARATELANDLKAEVKIVPIGLNYTNPHKFRSDLYVNIGEPIMAADFFSIDEEAEKEEVKALTAHMESKMIDSILHLEIDEYDELLDQVNDSYSKHLINELGVSFKDQKRHFELNKLTLSAFSFFKDKKPALYEEMKGRIQEYFDELDSANISDRALNPSYVKRNLQRSLFLIWSFPLFLIGFLGNVIPHQVSTALIKLINAKDSFRGSIILAVSMFIFLLWYIGATVALWKLTPLAYYSLFLPIILYISGFIAMIYLSVAKQLSKYKKMKKVLKGNPELAQNLEERRSTLIKDFETLRSEFDAQQVVSE